MSEIENKNESVYQSGVKQDAYNCGGQPLNLGLKKREYFAGLAMQALIDKSYRVPGEVAGRAVMYADALLEELKEGKGDG